MNIIPIELNGRDFFIISIFQLEKSREAVDLANTRAAYAEVMTAALTEDTNPTTNATEYTLTYDSTNSKWTAVVDLTQKEAGWKSTVGTIGGVTPTGSPTSGGTATITYDGTTTTVVFA